MSRPDSTYMLFEIINLDYIFLARETKRAKHSSRLRAGALMHISLWQSTQDQGAPTVLRYLILDRRGYH